MDKKDDQHLREIFAKKFDDYNVHLPEKDWEMFMAKRQALLQKHHRSVIIRWMVAASILCLLIGGLSYQFFHSDNQHALTSTISTSSLKNEGISTPPLPLTIHSVKKNASVLATALSRSSTLINKPIQKLAALDHSNVSEYAQNDLNQLLINSDFLYLSSTSPMKEITMQAYDELLAGLHLGNVSSQDSTAAKQDFDNLLQLPDMANQTNSSSSSENHHASAGWLALHVQGNNGLPTNFSNNNAWTQPASLDYRLLSQVNRDAAIPTQHATSNMITFIDKKTYAFPISWGLTFSQPFCPRWELQTGLVYTQLVTTGEVTSTLSNRATGRIEQNYLGIPLKIAYSFVEQPSFSLYLSAGGGVEKGVSLVEKIYNYNNNTAVLQDSYSTGIHGFQFSLDANVGATYRLYKFLYIYMETGGAYYIPSDQPESYRTVHPLGISLKFGIQFKLYHK